MIRIGSHMRARPPTLIQQDGETWRDWKITEELTILPFEELIRIFVGEEQTYCKRSFWVILHFLLQTLSMSSTYMQSKKHVKIIRIFEYHDIKKSSKLCILQ